MQVCFIVVKKLYPYKDIDDWEKFDETSLSGKEDF